MRKVKRSSMDVSVSFAYYLRNPGDLQSLVDHIEKVSGKMGPIGVMWDNVFDNRRKSFLEDVEMLTEMSDFGD